MWGEKRDKLIDGFAVVWTFDGNGLRGCVSGKTNENDCVVMRATRGHDRRRYGGVDREIERERNVNGCFEAKCEGGSIGRIVLNCESTYSRQVRSVP